MAEPVRKITTTLSFAYSSLKKSLGLSGEHQSPAVEDEYRVGEYRVDYTMPSREELQAADRELEELFANSKTVSVNK
jgi:hypothetical protein